MIPPPLETLPHELDRAKLTCQAIVEAPAGSRVKVYYDPESHRFRIGKFLPLGRVFTLDFAFIPSTLAGDGDPVDLLILPEAGFCFDIEPDLVACSRRLQSDEMSRVHLREVQG